ncbi:MAG: SGNH/GDSL hydrolase family protein [Phycisphaerae bacterium]|nr:SGNH/GDSL hydrolase family protein [Phycisphaerae bacterium]
MQGSHPTDESVSRRRFLGATMTAATASLATVSALSSSGCSRVTKRSSAGATARLIANGDVVLLQGDSITDAGRDRGREGNANDGRALGGGYAYLIASRLLAERADANLKIYNRGISGNKVFQLAERWDKDCIALKPNVLSVLIGVNDIWHKLNGQYDGTVAVYERDYRALLERTKRELPAVKLVVCEPFVLRCGAVNEKWFPEFDGFRAAAKKVATSFGAVFVPFQSAFDEAVKKAPPAHWAGDGVHPTMAGAALMAQTWLAAVSKTA